MSSSSKSGKVQYSKESFTEGRASEPEFEKPETSNYVYRWAERKGLPSGAYGSIYRVPRKRYDDDTGKVEIVAVKAVRIREDEESPQPDPREISALSFLKEHPHRNISERRAEKVFIQIPFYERFDSNDRSVFNGTLHACFVFPFIEFDLGDVIGSFKPETPPWPEERVARVTIQILKGLQHLHKHHFVHRDIKPDNVMIYQERRKDRIKLIDFGLAAKLPFDEDIISTNTWSGSQEYLSPEEWTYKIGYTSDVWATGVLIFELCNREAPWEANLTIPDSVDELMKEKILDRHLKDKILTTEPYWKPEVWGNYPNVKAFTKKLLRKDHARRPTAKQALEDSWLKTFSDELTEPSSTTERRTKSKSDDQKSERSAPSTTKSVSLRTRACRPARLHSTSVSAHH